jgi:hypothetical protein
VRRQWYRNLRQPNTGAIVAGSSFVIDVSKRWATVRTAAERLLTTPAMSRFSTDTVSDAV